MKTPFSDLPVRVLIYREDNDFVAHALEMDLLGYGKTEKAAKKALDEAIAAQIAFADSKERPAMVFSPAPRDIFKRWEAAQQAQIRGLSSRDQLTSLTARATVTSIASENIPTVSKPRTPAPRAKVA